MTPSKVLVTGGAGFIGSHVVNELISHGFEVAIVDDLFTGRLENINPKARFYQLDIRNPGLAEVFDRERPDYVSHHAAQVNVTRSVKEPIFDAQVNILGSLNVIENSIKYRVKKFIYASSGGAVYGEPKYLPVGENHPVEPISHYGVTKHTVEHYLSLYHHNYGLKFTILRYPNVYGPRQDPKGEAGVVAIFSQQMLMGIQPTIFGDGSKTRDYVYISDIVRANLLAVDDGDGEILNLGWGKEVSDFEVFDAVRKALKLNIEPIYGEKRKGEIERICLDAKKAKMILSWEPAIPLAEGVSLAVEYYKEARVQG